MRRRIFGLETEYGVVVVPTAPTQDPLPDVEAAVRLLFAATPNANRTTNHFLANGGRLYVDIGAHPEYAGAECDRLHDAVAGDRAGDALLVGLVDTANATLAEREAHARIHLLRNNTDSVGNTFGCHENYQVPREVDFDRLTDAMTSFLVSRIVLTGCGHIVADGDGTGRLAFSTRAEHIATTTSADPTKARPLINTKDEPHADGRAWRRLHVLSGDTNVADHATALKLGWTALFLDLVEAGVDVDDLVPLDPMSALRVFNADLTGRATVAVRGGGELSAVDIQQAVLDRVDRAGLVQGPEADWVVDLVAAGLDAVRTGDLDAVGTRLDWAVKQQVLGEYAARNGLDLGHPRVRRMDFAYHDIDPVVGLAPRLRAAGLLASYVTDGDIDLAVHTPPQTTRARVRGDFVAWVERHGFQASVNWAEVRLNRPVGRPVELPDAFAAQSPALEEMKALFVPG